MAFLRLENVTKDFYNVVVLKDMSFSIDEGEIVALVGENGAGKTTLMHILFGMPDIIETGGFSGAFYIDEQEACFKTPFDALEAGIGMVHQEFSLIPGFKADENILLNREPVKKNFAVEIFGERMAHLRRDSMRKKSGAAIERLGISIAPETPVEMMSVAHKQFTEVAREISRENTRLLVMDEPTAVLTESEASLLLESLKRIAASGISIIFISHRLHEVISVASRIIVLRDGHIIKDTPNKNVSVRDIAGWMVGRQIESRSEQRSARVRTGGSILEVEHLRVDMPGEPVRDVSFSVQRGEIFGIGALAGQGKLGIPNGIMGLYPAGGSVRFNGETWTR
ncbi:MAG: ATP-binding cassette domain-containing protein, partial [Spirochaetaceae bacterium]|nr:ATP-binding cassette domain-containing protein [Spirochaetaceae bacterium]